MDLLRRIAHERRIGILLSCHDIDLALREADRLWLMEPGGAFHAGTPDQLRHGALGAAFAREGVRFDTQTGHCVPASRTAS
jgi:iron complex transport system ATP-binding protein